jgi:hypothetical protein
LPGNVFDLFIRFTNDVFIKGNIMKLTIEIHLDNASFQNDNNELDYHTIQDLLVLTAQDIGDGNIDHSIQDINGNNVGQYFID